MRLLPALPLLLALSACATQVTHPTKTAGEMREDIRQCTAIAEKKHYWDALKMLDEAYVCLDGRGYQRGRSGLAEGVRSAVAEKERPTVRPAARTADAPRAPRKSCTVPCRPDGGR